METQTENTNVATENQESEKYIECPRCKTKVNIQELACPVCGSLTSKMQSIKETDEKNSANKTLIIMFVILVIFAVVFSMIGIFKDNIVCLILGMIGILIVLAVYKIAGYAHVAEENARIEAKYDENFTPTEIIKPNDYGTQRYIEVDMKNKRWRINLGSIYEFKDLRDFELLEKSAGNYTKSYTSPSMISVALNMGEYSVKNTHSTTHEYSQFVIRISFKDLSHQDEYILFTRNEKGSSEYNITFEKMEKCMSLLRKIKDYNEEHTIINEQTKNNSSVADELIKLKSLLDTGTITQEEFDAQKQKLL